MASIEKIINRKVLDNFNKDGAVLLKNVFKDWVDDIKIGIEKLINNPSPRERSYKPKDGTALSNSFALTIKNKLFLLNGFAN